jgi:membrane protein
METLQTRHILDAIRSGNEDEGLMQWRLPAEPAVDRLLEARDEAIDQAMQHQTLKDMVLAGMDSNTSSGEKHS